MGLSAGFHHSRWRALFFSVWRAYRCFWCVSCHANPGHRPLPRPLLADCFFICFFSFYPNETFPCAPFSSMQGLSFSPLQLLRFHFLRRLPFFVDGWSCSTGFGGPFPFDFFRCCFDDGFFFLLFCGWTWVEWIEGIFFF